MVDTGPFLLLSLPVNFTTISGPDLSALSGADLDDCKKHQGANNGLLHTCRTCRLSFLHWGYSQGKSRRLKSAKLRRSRRSRRSRRDSGLPCWWWIPKPVSARHGRSLSVLSGKRPIPKNLDSWTDQNANPSTPPSVVAGVPETYLLLKRRRSSSFSSPASYVRHAR